MELIDPWVSLGTEASKLEEELQKELGENHVLFNLSLKAKARCPTSDAVQFALADGRLAKVHLTWTSRKEQNSLWPATTLYPSFEHFKKDSSPS